MPAQAGISLPHPGAGRTSAQAVVQTGNRLPPAREGCI